MDVTEQITTIISHKKLVLVIFRWGSHPTWPETAPKELSTFGTADRMFRPHDIFWWNRYFRSEDLFKFLTDPALGLNLKSALSLGYAKCQYYGDYVENFAEFAVPLYCITEKHRLFSWSPEAETAFIRLKTTLTPPPMLASLVSSTKLITNIDPIVTNNETLMVLDRDASLTAAGRVLSQIQGGKE